MTGKHIVGVSQAGLACYLVIRSQTHFSIKCEGEETQGQQRTQPSPDISKLEKKILQFYGAIRGGRWDSIPQLIQHSAYVNLCDRQKTTPLHAAVSQPDVPVNIVNQLVSRYTINAQDNNGRTPLYLVVSTKRWDLVPELLSHGADVNLCSKWNNSPSHAAMQDGDIPVDTFTKLVSPQNLNMQDVNGRTTLQLAVRKGRWDLTLLLLQAGADINICDMQHSTELHDAIKANVPVGMVTKLISSNNINVKDENGLTAIQHVVKLERWHLLPVLLAHGAEMPDDLEFCKKILAKAPLMVIANLIGWMQDVNARMCGGKSIMHMAIEAKRYELVPYLMHLGIDVSLQDDTANTALHLAVCREKLPADIVSQLISSRNINLKNDVGLTALNLVITHMWNEDWDPNETPMLQLLENGAQSNLTDVLTILVSNYKPEYLHYLLQHLHGPLNLYHLTFHFKEGILYSMEVNDTTIYIPQSIPISAMSLIHIICHLLQETCIIHRGAYKMFSSKMEEADDNVINFDIEKRNQFGVMGRNLSPLMKLAALKVRQSLSCKSDGNVCNLGDLPPGILPLLTFSGLAEEINMMWLKASE